MFTAALFASAVLTATLLQATPPLSPTDAAKHIGETVTSCGPISGKHTAASVKGRPTFYDMGARYPNPDLTILVWGNKQAAVGELPTVVSVCVTGEVKSFKGKPEIVLEDSTAWTKK